MKRLIERLFCERTIQGPVRTLEAKGDLTIQAVNVTIRTVEPLVVYAQKEGTIQAYDPLKTHDR